MSESRFEYDRQVIICVTLFLLVFASSSNFLVPARAGGAEIRVPEDYEKIRWAVGNSTTGDTIIVSEGMYAEGPISITKSLTIIADGHVEVDGLGKGSVFTVNANNVTIKGFTLKNSGDGWARSGILLNHVQNCVIDGNNATQCWAGISLVFSHRNVVKKNIATKNIVNGIYVRFSNWNEIEENIFTDNGVLPASGRGMLLERSNGNIIRKNTANNNFWAGILLMFYNDENVIEENTAINNRNGIYLSKSCNNLVVRNVLRQNEWAGIKLRCGSNSNVIVGNMITDTYPLRGIFISAEGEPEIIICEGNRIYHNNLINNRYQFYNYMSNSTWDDGYPSGGNYWSDYMGSDLYSGPFQNETGSDGIGDTPYTIDANNADRYPLMNPWAPFTTASVSIDPSTINLATYTNKWVTAHIELPKDYDPANIDITTVRINGTVPPVTNPKYGFVTNSSEYIVDRDGDGILERLVKFNSTEVIAYILNSVGYPASKSAQVTLTITGKLYIGTTFEGSVSVKIIKK